MTRDPFGVARGGGFDQGVPESAQNWLLFYNFYTEDCLAGSTLYSSATLQGEHKGTTPWGASPQNTHTHTCTASAMRAALTSGTSCQFFSCCQFRLRCQFQLNCSCERFSVNSCGVSARQQEQNAVAYKERQGRDVWAGSL